MNEYFSLVDFTSALDRLSPYIRRTPTLDVTLDNGLPVTLKLENLQVSGSFKIRGAMNTVLGLDPAKLERGLVTASGGNHGMGVATAGTITGTPTTIHLPENTPQGKIDKLRTIATEVIVKGAVWDDANALALAAEREQGKTYIHPFADKTVIEGQGTITLELLKQAPELDTLLVAIGGGGLIAGVASAAKLINPDIRIIGIEAEGAPTLHDSLKEGKLVTLERIATRAGTLAPRCSAPLNLEIISGHVDDILLVSDQAMEESAKWLWSACGIATELAAAAAIAALRSGTYQPAKNEKTGVIICGAGPDGFAD
ncbi:pyridoxal-phosphate dependent enzyme [Sneathiella chinensis]|uniref:Serine/threonine dehydratase n=1 Tax=Sneathiella chinensis TaxID=349750 RepID=A0ABQ5U2D5_9PROT|nr:pyridoxal-phosphate dependent enzyme [Sneathiella chinensis]GLQ05502.1 serine/threonine dehydratase [Sneathiella chinensis]